MRNILTGLAALLISCSVPQPKPVIEKPDIVSCEPLDQFGKSWWTYNFTYVSGKQRLAGPCPVYQISSSIHATGHITLEARDVRHPKCVYQHNGRTYSHSLAISYKRAPTIRPISFVFPNADRDSKPSIYILVQKNGDTVKQIPCKSFFDDSKQCRLLEEKVLPGLLDYTCTLSRNRTKVKFGSWYRNH